MQQRRVNVRGIVFRDGKILATKFKNNDGTETDWWGTFGGGLDLGESLHDGLHREMIEETGVAPVIGKLLFIQQFKSPKMEQLEFFFNIENVDDYLDFKLEDTSHGHLELARHDFIDPRGANLWPQFLEDIDIADYIDNERPTFIWNELPKTADLYS